MEEEPNLGANVGGARRQARKLLLKAGVKNAPVSINNLIKFISEEHDLNIFRTNALPSSCDALTANINGKITISCNSSKPVNRQKFSAAHEIGHVYMGHVHTGGQIRYDSKSPNETEANAFAAELIMPLEVLKKDIAQKLGTIKDYAKKYAVSEEAMGWRIYETGLFKKM